MTSILYHSKNSAEEAAVTHAAAARLVDAGASGATEDEVGISAGGDGPAEVLSELGGAVKHRIHGRHAAHIPCRDVTVKR